MSKKFGVSLKNREMKVLNLHMKERGVTIQELLRAVVIPEWLDRKGYVSIRLIRPKSDKAGDSHAGR